MRVIQKCKWGGKRPNKYQRIYSLGTYCSIYRVLLYCPLVEDSFVYLTKYQVDFSISESSLWVLTPIDVLVPVLPDTVILKDEKKLSVCLLYFLNNRTSPLRLCYRASLHGWSSQEFHKQCDDKAATVVLVKVGNWIFGGYTDQTWQGKIFYFRNFSH